MLSLTVQNTTLFAKIPSFQTLDKNSGLGTAISSLFRGRVFARVWLKDCEEEWEEMEKIRLSDSVYYMLQRGA